MNLGGEGLGADEEEGRLGIDQLQRFGHVRPVHIAVITGVTLQSEKSSTGRIWNPQPQTPHPQPHTSRRLW